MWCVKGIMPLSSPSTLSCMNTYDSKHLRLLNLIQVQCWSDIGDAEIQELRVLIACKYVTVTDRVGKIPTIKLTPEGRHYHLRLAELESRKAGLESLMADLTPHSYQVSA